MFKILTFIFFLSATAWGCTSFQLKSLDGAPIYCRSLEFGFPMHSDMIIVSKGTSYAGTAQESMKGLKWKVKHGFVGMNQTMAKTLVNDGMNEKGLVVGCLYLPGFAQYEPLQNASLDRTLGCWELPTFLLSTCSTVKEVKASMASVLVAQQPMPQLKGFFLPVHYHVSDATGESIVIEYVAGRRKIYDNPLGILTNSPPFDWQLENLSTYINLSAVNAPPLQLKEGYRVQFAGQGSGLLGLPGDYSPRSRFVRAALFSSFAATPKTALHAVRLGFHLLNTFDIPEGLVRGSDQELPAGSDPLETTQWVIVHDQKNRKTYFRSYESLAIQMIDLKRIDFSEENIKIIPLRKEFVFEDTTDNAKPLLLKDS